MLDSNIWFWYIDRMKLISLTIATRILGVTFKKERQVRLIV